MVVDIRSRTSSPTRGCQAIAARRLRNAGIELECFLKGEGKHGGGAGLLVAFGWRRECHVSRATAARYAERLEGA